MAQNRAELIFVAGPQQGERSLLMAASVVVGRHPSCDIQITEHTVSRQQARLQLTPHGWVVTSVASSPIRVNGKRYKAGQQIILDTGDLLGVGTETEMLFVAQGHDEEAALAEMRQTCPQFANFAGITQTTAAREQSQQFQEPPTMPLPAAQEAELTPREIAEPEPAEPIDETDEAEEAERAKKIKLRKYMIGFGIYGALFVGFIIVMYMRPTGDIVDNTRLERLTNRELQAILTKDLDLKERPTRAGGALDKARRYYDDFPQRPGAMYMAVKHFQIYLAFTGRVGFADTENQGLYQSAKAELVKRVTKFYRKAWKETKNEDWHAALRDFQYVLEMIPVQNEPHPDQDNALFTNVRRYIRFIREKTAKKDTRRF